MCSFVCSLVIFATTLATIWIPTILLHFLDIRLKPRTLIFFTICILLTWNMAASERGCCVPCCGKTRNDGTILHSFPNPDNDRERYLVWTRAVGLPPSMDPQYVYRNRRVCHDHFETKFLTWTRRLSPGAFPTLLLPGSGTEAAPSRAPLIDITNRPENLVVDAVSTIPSTAKGASSSQGKQSRTKSKKLAFEERTLLKAVKKLQIKKDNYATRLKKALKLSENKTFQNTLKKFTTLAAMFTLMQFREIGKSKMGRRFSEPEKILALSLYKRSPRAYRWLQKIFVLPSSMTLSRLIARANLRPGINENLFEQLKRRVAKMTPDEKLCILMFDEMSIAPHFSYNHRKDEMSGFVDDGTSRKPKLADHALVFMIRGIQKNYKQPVAYTFCSGTTNTSELSSLIKDIIRKLHSVGLKVLATVCDQGPSNVSSINALIQETKRKYLKEKNEFKRHIFEVDDNEIIPLYDPPHLIKGIRNNLLNKNLVCTIGGSTKVAKWEHIVQLHEEDPGYKGIKLVKKLTNNHINPDKFQKMKVKYATQVLSQKVAITMGFLAEKQIMPAECTQTADVILFFDELFDSVNGSFDNSKKRSGKTLLLPVKPKSEHHSVWTKAKQVLNTMKFVVNNKPVKIPTINNWLHTVNNVEYLIQKLFNDYNIKSVWMRHFNQDPLENFFGAIRSHGCRNTNPTAGGFESSFAALLINNLSGQHSPGSNCEEDTCQTVFKSMETLFKDSEKEPIHTELIDLEEGIYVDYEEKKKNPRILATLQYVTGYLIKKARTNIFKNCKTCKSALYDIENKSDYLGLREYKKGKRYLTYPSQNIIIIFSKIQDIITYLIKKKCMSRNIKTYIKTYLYIELDINNYFKCEEHKKALIEFLFELSCKFFLFNWCKDVNKIINGTSSNIDETDFIKMLAYDYFNKKKHNKRQKR